MSTEFALPSPTGALATANSFTPSDAIADQREKAAERHFTFVGLSLSVL
jgi:hypothetical protein